MDIHIGFFRAKAVGEYFNLRRTYKDLRYWLIGEGYCSSETTGFPERYFYLSETQKEGREFYVWWRPRRALGVFSAGLAGGKGVEFYKSLKINMIGTKFKDAEIMHGGKKIKVQKGTFEVIVHSMLHFGMPEWEGPEASDFKRALFDIFWKRIYKKNVEYWKKETLNDMYKLQAHLKKIMDMETWKPEGKTFEPHFGLPETEF